MNGVKMDPFDLTRKAAFFMVLGAFILASGCKESQTIWSAEAKSSDGKMIVTARAVANGGFGISGAATTFIDLNWTTGSQKPAQILSLENESDALDDAKVGINWLGPSHLELTYMKGRQHIGFQAVKYAGVDISLRDLSGETSK
jgi:hypothetical protein